MSAPGPKPGIDWAHLSLTQEAIGHIETRHRASTGEWSTPILETSPNISISGLCSGLNYGQQCYEGMKASRTPENKIVVMRPKFHAARMARSAAAVCLPPVPEDLFLECVRQAVVANAELIPPSDTESFLYIRPVLFGVSHWLHPTPPQEALFAIYVQPVQPLHGVTAIDALVLEDFDRCAPKGMGPYKVGGNYSPVWRHAAKAKEMGFGITLHLDSATRTFVDEFSTSGFLGHKTINGRHVLVLPESENVIDSATSDSIVRLAKREGWVIEKNDIPFTSISGLDEVVAVGTAACAVPIRSITRLSTEEKYTFDSSNGKLMDLASLLIRIQRGRANDTEGWCHEIEGFGARVKESTLHEGKVSASISGYRSIGTLLKHLLFHKAF